MLASYLKIFMNNRPDQDTIAHEENHVRIRFEVDGNRLLIQEAICFKPTFKFFTDMLGDGKHRPFKELVRIAQARIEYEHYYEAYIVARSLDEKNRSLEELEEALVEMKRHRTIDELLSHDYISELDIRERKPAKGFTLTWTKGIYIPRKSWLTGEEIAEATAKLFKLIRDKKVTF